MRPVYLLYDERMKLHVDKRNDTSESSDRREEDKVGENHDDGGDEMITVENPQRIACIFQRLMELQSRINTHCDNYETEQSGGISEEEKKVEPFIRLSCPMATKETIELAHSPMYYQRMYETSSMSSLELKLLPTIDCTKNLNEKNDEDDDEDMYFCKDTFQAASLACGGVVESVNAVTGENSKSTRALALVRPPSHHACAEKAMGFCFFNSVVVAAKYAIHTKRSKKVLIFDWDIHHGNGSQDLTYEDGNIMYISLHRFSKGTKTSDPFFPGTGKPSEVGVIGTDSYGMNINVAWQKSGMGNAEYGAAFSELLLPVIAEYSPDLIMISCGLDAAKGDFLGDCCLTPSMYYLMTQSLIMTVGSDIPTVVALEGGYSLDVISDCMESVALAMLDLVINDDPLRERPQDQTGQVLVKHFKNIQVDLKSPEEQEDRLALGRKMMSAVWDYENKSTSIDHSAIRDINKTIHALLDCQWIHADVRPLKVVKKAFPSRMTTRSSLKKLEATRTEIGNLDSMMQTLNI